MTLLNITGIRTLIATHICIICTVWLLLKAHSYVFAHNFIAFPRKSNYKWCHDITLCRHIYPSIALTPTAHTNNI